MQRYSRQIILPNFGNEAQNLLAKSKVLVVGAGGLGVPVLQHLAAAGVGKLGIADGDIVEISNLQRQVLYNETELGKNKAQVAKEKITKLNSTIELEVYDFFIDTLSIFKIITDYDVVVDCTDHFSIRYLLNDVCYLQKKPLVFASIYQFEAQLSVFHYGEKPYNLRDVFSEIPNEKAFPNCNEAGVLGTLAGIAGNFQANEVIKIITKIGVVNSGKLLLFNSLNNQIAQLSITKNEEIFLPTSKEEILQNNYGFFCADEFTVENIEILEQILNNKNTALVDVREKNELPKITTFPVLEIPLSDLPENMALLQQFDALVFICKSGIRSKKAVLLLQEMAYAKPCYSVQKGVEFFKK